MLRQTLTVVAALFTYVGAADIEYPYTFEFTGNPLSPHVSSADPSAHVWDDTLWVYTSKDGNLLEHGFDDNDSWTYAHMDGYHAYSTTDLVTWTDHGEILNSADVSWSSSGWMWAPCAAKANGKYYLYYPHKDVDDSWKIGVATADAPQGPFTDIGAPIAGTFGIDPMIFFDDDGEVYMYMNSAEVAKMKPNMIELAEEFRSVDYGPESVQNDRVLQFEEGSYMHKYKGKYYYSYSNSKQSAPTAYYAIGDSPYGPFEWQGPLAGAKHSSPDHHSIIEFKGAWYYFYHMDTTWEHKNQLGWHGHRRIACFEPMYYNDDGTIQFQSPSYFYVNAGGQSTVENGHNYMWDLWYEGGNGVTYDDDKTTLTKSVRTKSEFSYDIPMSNGVYDISLTFAEHEFESEGERLFDIFIEGEKVVSELDVIKEAGGQAKVHLENISDIELSDSEMNIVFQGVVEKAIVSAMAIKRTNLPQPLEFLPPSAVPTTRSPSDTPTTSPTKPVALAGLSQRPVMPPTAAPTISPVATRSPVSMNPSIAPGPSEAPTVIDRTENIAVAASDGADVVTTNTPTSKPTERQTSSLMATLEPTVLPSLPKPLSPSKSPLSISNTSSPAPSVSVVSSASPASGTASRGEEMPNPSKAPAISSTDTLDTTSSATEVYGFHFSCILAGLSIWI